MGMEMDKECIAKLVNDNKPELAPLLPYLDWLKANNGKRVSTVFDGTKDGSNTMSFPVYDSDFLGFVKAAGNTKLMDRNYVYAYTWYDLSTPEKERQAIEKATIEDWKILCGIFTKYVRGGMTQASLWDRGMEEGIFYLVLAKMQEVLDGADE